MASLREFDSVDTISRRLEADTMSRRLEADAVCRSSTPTAADARSSRTTTRQAPEAAEVMTFCAANVVMLPPLLLVGVPLLLIIVSAVSPHHYDGRSLPTIALAGREPTCWMVHALGSTLSAFFVGWVGVQQSYWLLTVCEIVEKRDLVSYVNPCFACLDRAASPTIIRTVRR